MAERAAYLGPRLRRLRRDLGLTQPGMAADLGVSTSYVSLLESNQRPLTADMLVRLARTYRIDLSDFAGDGGAEFAGRLQQVLRDPLFADIDLPPLHAADVATNYPGIAEALIRLHGAHRAEQSALADRQAAPGDAAGGRLPDAVVEVRRFLAAERNAFPALDEAAEGLAARMAADGGAAAFLARHHGLRVRPAPPAAMGGLVRRHDPHRATVYLDDTLDGAARAFQLALQVAYLRLSAELDAILARTAFAADDGRRLARRALANHAAGAILMPFAAFAAAAEEARYDVEALARRFGTSFEQTAHRLTTLGRPGDDRVRFFFIRLDAAGNVSKRLDGAGFPFAAHGGGCPLWSVHHVFQAPGRLAVQWLELPDGQRFFSVARTVVAGGGHHGAARVERAVALVCAAEQTARLAYADGVSPAAAPYTPIGVTCALCQRDRCQARAVPPIGRAILPDDYHRGLTPFAFADG